VDNFLAYVFIIIIIIIIIIKGIQEHTADLLCAKKERKTM
jgi:hypothetical protein